MASRFNRLGKRNGTRTGRALRSESLERREVLSGNGLGGAVDIGPVDAGAGAGDCDTVQVGAQDGGHTHQQQSQTSDTGRSSQHAARPPFAVSPRPGGNNGSGGQVTSDTLDAQETADLLHMREEEKLARDVYQTLGDKYDVAVFDNIAASEQQHMDSMLTLLDKYGLEDPVGDNPVGVFEDPALQSLYDQLVARGEQSLEDAYQVGVTIEELDIADLQEAIETTDNADIARAYGNLLSGSQNHLTAFTAALDGQTTPNTGAGNANGGANGNGNADANGSANMNNAQNGSGGGQGQQTGQKSGQSQPQLQTGLTQSGRQTQQGEQGQQRDRVFREYGSQDSDQLQLSGREVSTAVTEELALDRVRRGR
ncbi:MAG: DUF2202 domain-containing protein [Planctomycetales bacterium]|nr:DUF2202 domain-containing protein [Planctomycetales bacterium]